VGYGALCATGAFATAWILSAHTLWLLPAGPAVSRHASELQIISQAFGQTATWLHQMVGVLGWVDTPLPVWTYAAWGVAAVALISVALWAGWIRATLVLLGLIALSFVLPVGLELVNAKTVGLTWQGRYTLPLVVGVPLLAASCAGIRAYDRKAQQVFARTIVVVLAIVGVLGYLQALRRYAVGTRGPLDFLGGSWHPVEGTVIAILWYLAATAVLARLLWPLMARPDLALHPSESEDAAAAPMLARA
jgi:Predicted membrane protein (DUF2142)